jgi:serine/alanine adding enzyme
MQVLELSQPDKAFWDEYVQNEELSSVYHLSGWKDLMARTFGLRSHYLLAKEGDDVLGVLPLLHVKSRLSGHFLTSMPGGMCARDLQVAAALLGRAKELVRSAGAKYLILRDGQRKWDLPDLATDENHCLLVVELSADQEQVWRGLKKRARQLTSQAMRAGLEVVNGTEIFEQLYPIYSRAMRDRGTPTLGLGFFSEILTEFPGLFEFLAVRRKDRFLGGGFVTPWRDTVYCTWGGMLRQYYDLRPNHLLYWETLKYGVEGGFHWLDFGRSRYESGTFVFKQAWGGKPRPLYQQYYLNGLTHPPAVGAGRKADPKYRVFVDLWKRLPLPVTEVLGPQLRRRMPFG